MAFTVWFQKHIYENQLGMLQQQLTREPYESPQFAIADRVPDYAKTGVYEPEWLEKVEPSDFSLVDYRHHEPLTAPMAV
jgi:thymidylate synthase